MDFKQAKEVLGEDFGRSAEFLNLIVNKLNLDKKATLLDVGTGRGHMAITLAVNGYDVITGEPEGDNWADWESKAKKVNAENNITFKPFRAENLPFDDEFFDAIFIFGSFHHIHKKNSALQEFWRTLKSFGILVIIELTELGVESVRERFSGHPDAIDPTDYTKIFDFEVEIVNSKYLDAFIYKKRE
jgi:ubiquinone/menaquinone biosynthesis C-methylase UbiE